MSDLLVFDDEVLDTGDHLGYRLHGSPTLVARSGTGEVSGTQSLGPQSGIQPNQVQIFFVTSHQTFGSPTVAGFTFLGQFTTGNTRTSVYTRVLDLSNIGSSATATIPDKMTLELRTYKDAGAVTLGANGTGAVTNSVQVPGALVRVWSGISAGSATSINPDAALTGGRGSSFAWYGGLAVGDDPTTANGTAPARTATGTVSQWFNVMIAPTQDSALSILALQDQPTLTIQETVGSDSFVILENRLTLTDVVQGAQGFILVDAAGPIREQDILTGQETMILTSTGSPGPPGPMPEMFSYQMPSAQTTAVITHNLGRDPIAVQVFDHGQLCDEYSVVFTIPGTQVTIGFDVAAAALIRLM